MNKRSFTKAFIVSIFYSFLSSCFYSKKCDQVVTETCNDNDSTCAMKTECENDAYTPSVEGLVYE